MLRVQVLLSLVIVLAAGEALVGEAGLVELAAARSGVQLVAGEGTRTIQRLDEPDEPADAKRVRFAVAANGRYDITITDPADPEGPRTRMLNDGTSAWLIELADAADQAKPKRSAAADDLMARILACLRLDLASLRRDYDVQLIATPDARRELRLTPTNPAVLREVKAIVVVLDHAGRPQSVLLDDTSQSRHRLAVSAFTDNPEPDPLWFRTP